MRSTWCGRDDEQRWDSKKGLRKIKGGKKLNDGILQVVSKLSLSDALIS